MGEPDFSFDGVDENEAFDIEDGETVIDKIRQSVATGVFEDVEFVAHDDGGNDYFLECVAFATLNRFGKDRLYFAVMDREGEQDRWYAYYIAQRADGAYLLVHETDEGMFNAFSEKIDSMQSAETVPPETGKKKKSGGWKIALKIILFPFWIIWELIKGVLSLFNIAVGDSSAVKAFKRGYNGEDAPMKEYTFTNRMGCRQTVYSSDGKEFYDADGSFVGTSNDNGKTIKEK